MTDADTAPKPRRRKRKILLVVLGLLVLVIAFLPKIAAPFVRGTIESALGDSLNADVSVGSLGLGWGSAKIGELTIVGADGRRHARVESLTASAPLFAALRGSYSPTVRIANVELDAERDADGNWSFQDLLPARDEESADKEKDKGGAGSDGSPLASADIEVENVTVRVKSPEGSGRFVLAFLRAEQTGADTPLTVDANGSLSASSPTSAELASTFTLEAETDFASFVHHLALEGALLSGTTEGKLLLEDPLRAEGLKADLTYVPDHLAALLGALLPIEMSGAEPERLALDYTGALDATDVKGLMTAGEGKVSIGLGKLAFAGIETGGDVGVDLTGGAAALTGNLALNGGALTLSGGVSPEGGLTLGIGADAVRSSAALAPLLSSVHPVFASLDKLEGTGLEGLLSGRLDLAWDGELPLTKPEGGWAKLPLDRLSGSGSLQVGEARLNSSPFVAQMLNAVGSDAAGKKVSMQPLGFSLKGSRVHYDNDWGWKVAGSESKFSGSVGFDKGLDLVWTLPVTAELAQKAGVKQLAGKTLTLPIGGTALKPKVDWTGALKSLAGDAALDIVKDTALEKLGDKLGDGVGEKLGGALGDKLGGGDVKDLVDGVLGGGDSEGEEGVTDSDDPKVILAEADALYEKGKKWKAAQLYDRLYEDHKLTTVYQLNKSRIKDRRVYKKD